MPKSPFLSVIVPVYKVERYLPECVASVLEQDCGDYELILVDDGSPDGCPALCDRYAAQDHHVRVIHKPNGGLSDARNAGVAVARGEYVIFMDSDDFWTRSDVVAECKAIASHYGKPDIIVSDFYKYYERTGRRVPPPSLAPATLNGQTKREMMEFFYRCQADMKMSAWQKFVKGELLTRVSFEKGLLSEDIDWSLQLYPLAKTLAVCATPFYCYRQQRKGSIVTTGSAKSFRDIVHIVEKWRHRLPETDIPQWERELWQGYLAYQLTTAMVLYPKLPAAEHHEARESLRRNLPLFRGTLNPKTKKIRLLLSTIGLRATCHVCAAFVRLRHRLNSRQ